MLTTFTGERLAISLPGTALAALKLPGAVFPVELALSAPLSDPVRAALTLVAHHGRFMTEPPLIVARPEMYPEGATLAWLMARLEGVAEHVAISDGGTARPIPGLTNHLFLCELASAGGEARLAQLVDRATESFRAFASQINSARAIVGRRHIVSLPTRLLPGAKAEERPLPPLRRFYLNRSSIDDSLNRIGSAEPVDPATLSGHEQVTIVATSEVALADSSYARALAELVVAHFFDPSRLLILQPPGDEASHGLLLAALAATSVAVPRAIAPNLFLAPADANPAQLAALAAESELVLSDDAPMWRLGPADYTRFAGIRILARRGPVQRQTFAALADALAGRPCAIEWLRRERLA